MNAVLLQIKVDLNLAMMIEIKAIKNPANGDFIVSQQRAVDDAIDHKTVARAIISMIPDLKKKPDETTEEDIFKLLKKYISQEKERTVYQLGYLKEKDVSNKSPQEVRKLVSETILACGDELTSNKIKIAQSYLPAQATEEEITEYVKNLDMTQFKNKMQAMGPIMKRFKGCDGNFVKAILLKS